MASFLSKRAMYKPLKRYLRQIARFYKEFRAFFIPQKVSKQKDIFSRFLPCARNRTGGTLFQGGFGRVFSPKTALFSFFSKNFIKEPLIYSAAHLRHIFSRLLLAEKLDVHPVHLAFFAIADEKICTESAPPHSISVSLNSCV